MGFGGAFDFGFATADLLAGTVVAAVKMGDFFRKTDGEGIWTSMRRRRQKSTWTRPVWPGGGEKRSGEGSRYGFKG